MSWRTHCDLAKWSHKHTHATGWNVVKKRRTEVQNPSCPCCTTSNEHRKNQLHWDTDGSVTNMDCYSRRLNEIFITKNK